MLIPDYMAARARQNRNAALYLTLDQASGMPYQQMPEPVMTGQSTPQEANTKKGLWILLLGVGAFFLFGHAFKKGVKK